ncbi:MAG: RNA-binding protein [Roseiarcus sp.]
MESGRQSCHIPAMPKHPKRPRDANQLAKLMVDILTGEVEDREPTPEEGGVDPAASAMGKKGGPARPLQKI